MLEASTEFKTKIINNSKTILKANLHFANGETLALTGDDFIFSSAKFSDAVASDNVFSVGAAIINKFTITLNNLYDKFSKYDFTGATIEPFVGVILDNGEIEWIAKGVYGIEQPKSYEATITLDCLDNMRLLEKNYKDIPTHYPATLGDIVRDIVKYCGVILITNTFTHDDYVVNTRPDDDGLSCIDVLSAAMQISVNYARFTNKGELELKWYNTKVFENEDWLDGGVYDNATPYATGDKADGGTFEYTDGDNINGGKFDENKYVHLYALSQIGVSTDDVVITGLRVKACDAETGKGEDKKGETVLVGKDGYVIEFSNNALIEFGRANEVAKNAAPKLLGMRFRLFDVSSIPNPLIEAGDAVLITDRKQNSYKSYITRLNYQIGSYTTLSCGGETPSRNNAHTYSEITKNFVQMRKKIRQEQTEREIAVKQLNENIENSSGMYTTTETQSDGSTITYLHNKPTIADSKIVWKLTADAFALSNDGGNHYNYAIDASGNAILNKIYAVGLNADFIKTGSFTVKDKDNRIIFSADKDTGKVILSSDCVSIGGEKLTKVVNGVKARYAISNSDSSTKNKYAACDGFELKDGSVINVRFTKGNTAKESTLNVNGTGDKPMVYKGSWLPDKDAWQDNDILTFVYTSSNDWWNLVDSGANSKLETLRNSISLSVNGSLGNRANITLGVGDRKTSADIDMSGVRQAFANDNSYITITAGEVNFVSNTFSVDSDYFKVSRWGELKATRGIVGGFNIDEYSIWNSSMILNADGLNFYRDKTRQRHIGHIGAAFMTKDIEFKGVAFNLDSDGDYMTWGVKENKNDESYYMKLTYYSKNFKGNLYDHFYFHAPVDFTDHYCTSMKIRVSSLDASEIINSSIYNCNLRQCNFDVSNLGCWAWGNNGLGIDSMYHTITINGRSWDDDATHGVQQDYNLYFVNGLLQKITI